MPSTATAKAFRGRKSASLPSETVEYLKLWMMHPDHISHPYPTDQEKASIMADTGIELKQLTNWFVNNRKRYWKPRVEAAAAGTPTKGQQVVACGATVVNQTKIQVDGSHPPTAASSRSTSSSASSLDSSSLDERHWQQEEAAAVAAVAALHQAQPEDIDASAAADHEDQEEQQQDDPHTISEGSVSSCADTDDDDSHDDSFRSRNRRDSSSTSSSHMYISSSQLTTSSTSIMTADGYRRHEEVDIYILRPEYPTTSSNKKSTDETLLPTIRDLTIKSSVSKERILAVYKCPITYTIPFDMEHDKRRVQSRRDGEVLRAKKYYLKLYLTSPSRGISKEDETTANDDEEDIVDIEAPMSPTNLLNDGPASSSSNCLDLMTYHHAVSPALSRAVSSASITTTTTARRRMREFSIDDLERAFKNVNESVNHSRKCARTVTTHDWREMCCNASGAYDTNLPSLEEAARMFGFTHTL